MKAQEIKKLFFNTDPYEGLSPGSAPMKVKGWHSDRPVIRNLIKEHRPDLYVEVGTWLGASAIHAADVMDGEGLESPIICIDTWLGAQEFWEDVAHNERHEDLELRNGYPSVYHRFLANVLHAGHAGRIVPLPQTSLIAGRLLRKQGLKAGLIYIDCSHDEGDVLRDIETYWEILEDNGILFGDDYDEFWPGLVHDVNRFAVARGLEVETRDGVWILKKSSAAQGSSPPEETSPAGLLAALQTENAVLRSRLLSVEGHIEVIRGERDKTVAQMMDRMERAERTAGFFAEKSQELEKRLTELPLAGDQETIRELMAQVQEMERRAGFFAEKARRLQEIVDEQQLARDQSPGKDE